MCCLRWEESPQAPPRPQSPAYHLRPLLYARLPKLPAPCPIRGTLGPAEPALVWPVAAEGDPSEPLRPPTGDLRGSGTRPVAIVSGPHGLAPAGRRFPSSSSGREGSQSAKPGWLEEVAAEAEGGALLPGRRCFSFGGGCSCRWLQKGGGSRVPGHGEEIRTRGHRELLSCSSGYRVDT